MLTRRTTMFMIGATGLLVAPPPLVRNAWAQSDDPAIAFIRSTTTRLVAIANDGGSEQETRRRLAEVVDATVDVDGLARFCLGRFWRAATPDQQEQYIVAFHELLVTKIGDHLGEYQGVQVTMGPARTGADTEVVFTTVKQSGAPARQIDWIVSTTAGGLKIVDLVAEGTSLRQTQSADFRSYLTRHNYDVHDLVEGMRQLAAANK